jgi:hypothetical protein
MKEEWKPVEGYEEYYQVSNMGRVKSLRRKNRGIDMIMTPVKAATKGRYRSVSLSVQGHIKKQLIHRLVAQAFIPNPVGYLEVNHLDGNPANNVVSNLEWCDKRHNHLHAYAIGLSKPIRGEDSHFHKLTEREVKFLRYLKGLYPQIKSIDVQRFYDLSWVGVERIWTGRTWKHI